MPSVAVLPFANLSGDPADDYVSDGVTSELTSRLAQAGHLLVISRISSMRFRNAPHDVREIGRDLGVRTLVEGSLRMRDGTCLVSANLIDVETGFHLWAGSFETPAERLFDVENEIVDRISAALSLTGRDAPRPAPTPAQDPKALESYLRAVQAYYKFTSADNLIAIELLHQAIERDPSLAKAHALLANACLARVERGWEANVVQWMGLALQASSDALRLDAGISEAYSARGLISFFGKRNEDAEADVREALRVDTNNDIAHDLLGRIRFARGEFMGAIAAYRDALAINPYYVWCLNDLAWALMVTGAEEEATRTLDRVLLLSPTDEGGHCGKAAMHLVYGRAREALAEIRKAQEVNPRYPWVLQLLPPILARNGMAAEAIAFCEALRAAGGDAVYFAHASLGLVCLETGDRDRLAECMRLAMEQVPFYPALDFSYASLYEAAGEVELAQQWVRKGVQEGIRLVEVNQWHPTLRSLAEGAGLIS
jgi:TolB-like protein/tetratricopeptide (TPR) repeat protein